jgi:hypothetical protein
MAKNNNISDFLTDLANAIREKENTTSLINPQKFNSRIREIANLSPANAVNYTTWKEFVKDIADTLREAEGTNEVISPQNFRDRLLALALSDENGEVGVPLYIEALEPITISFANTHEYSKDNNIWSSGTSSTSVSASTGEKVYYRATGLTTSSSVGIGAFSISGKCNVGGNIMSMSEGENYPSKTTLIKSDAFHGLFLNQTKIIDASKLSLPATTLSASCYYGLFEGCSNLTKAPTLPAMNLADKCYLKMFSDCVSLVNAPNLPATTMTESCYNNMFYGCSKLVSAPAELPALTMAYACYSNMFSKCSSLTTAPALPATTLNTYCYNNMFLECHNLETAPVLPALNLVSNCYRQMFQHCKKIDYIKAMYLTEPSDTYSQNWLRGVNTSGTFVKNSAATWSNIYHESVIPRGWTVQTASA